MDIAVIGIKDSIHALSGPSKGKNSLEQMPEYDKELLSTVYDSFIPFNLKVYIDNILHSHQNIGFQR